MTMPIIMNIFQGLILILIEVICCKIFFESFFDKRKFQDKWYGWILIPILVLIIYLGTALLASNILLKQIFVFFSMAFIMLVYFKSDFLRGVIITAIFQGLLLGIDCVGLIALKYLWGEQTKNVLFGVAGSMIVALICKMLLFGFVLIVRKLWNKKDSLNLLSDSEWLRFLYFPVITLIALISIAFNLEHVRSPEVINTMLIIGFGLVGMNILVLYLIRDIVEREVRLQEKYIIEERNRNQLDMYKLVCDNFDKQRKRTHEYKNQIGCIEGLLIDNKIKEVLEYVSNITGGLKKELDAIDTNNTIVNAILNSKYQEAVEKGIIFVLKVNDLSHIVIESEDIVTILSNLLNNAIEANEEIKNEKIIKLKFVDEGDYTIIAVKNTMHKEVEFINGKYQTSKDNAIEHGVGIENIADTIEKYNGSYIIKQFENYFNFTIIIPNKKPNES